MFLLEKHIELKTFKDSKLKKKPIDEHGDNKKMNNTQKQPMLTAGDPRPQINNLMPIGTL